MSHRSVAVLPCCCFALAAAMTGCVQHPPQAAPSEPPAVPVSQPVEQQVTDYVDFTGRTDAVQAVDVRARVTGYLTKMPFKEGAEVKEGDLLFEIDPRPYQAQLDQAASQVNLNEASLELAKATYERDQAVYSALPGSVSQQQLDQDQAAVEEAVARVKAAKASTEVYKLNLDFTKVKSPIDGQVSRYYLTRGNLVNQDQTLLTTVVSLDPMYAYFDMDEPTLLRIRRGINEGRIKPPQEGEMGLPVRWRARPGLAFPAAQGSSRGLDLHLAGRRRCRSTWGCRARTATRTRGRSTSSTTRSTPPRAASPCAASSPTRGRWEASGCCRPACSCASGCRSASRIRPCWSSTGPSARTRG